jgi:hypothetical protein
MKVVKGGSNPLQPLETRNGVAMEAAFDSAWMILSASNRRLSEQAACDARERMAKAICASFKRGERDPLRLHDAAMASLETLHPGD